MNSDYNEGFLNSSLANESFRHKSIHISLVIGEKGKEFYRTRVKKTFNKTVKKKDSPKFIEDVLKPKEVPIIPAYMPKLLARTPSPIKSTRTTFTKNKLNLFMPQFTSSPAELMLERRKKNNILITKVLNNSIKIEKIHSLPPTKPAIHQDKSKLTQYKIKLNNLIKRLNN